MVLKFHRGVIRRKYPKRLFRWIMEERKAKKHLSRNNIYKGGKTIKKSREVIIITFRITTFTSGEKVGAQSF